VYNHCQAAYSYIFCYKIWNKYKNKYYAWRNMMKKIVLIVTLIFAVALCGCDGGRQQELQEKLDIVESELYDVQSKMSDLESAISDLKSEIDDFSYENWRDNVPDVESAANEVESVFEDLKNEVDDVEYEL